MRERETKVDLKPLLGCEAHRGCKVQRAGRWPGTAKATSSQMAVTMGRIEVVRWFLLPFTGF